jgi:inner membrane protein
MPTFPTHALAGFTIVTGGSRWTAPASLSIAGAICAALPDLDVIAFRVGVAHGSMFGHRGVSHSLAFAAVLSLAIVSTGAFRGVGRRAAWLYLVACTASHGVLDAATNGGRGVAFFAPFSSARYFWDARPIAVSPIGLRAFFSHGGASVVASELRWVWLPCVALLAITYARRRVRAVPPPATETVA